MTVLGALVAILGGFRVTATVTLLSLAYAVPFAFLFGVGQFAATRSLRVLPTAVIEFWRSSPVVILLFVFYYALPSFGIRLPALAVATMVLGLNIGAYGSQAVRGALQALRRGQRQAGLAIGLTPSQTMLYVELPQACAAVAPTFVNLLIQLVKGTALVSLLTLTDMTAAAKALAQSRYDPVPIYGGLLLAYLLVCYPLTVAGRVLERRLARDGRGA